MRRSGSDLDRRYECKGQPIKKRKSCKAAGEVIFAPSTNEHYGYVLGTDGSGVGERLCAVYENLDRQSRR